MNKPDYLQTCVNVNGVITKRCPQREVSTDQGCCKRRALLHINLSTFPHIKYAVKGTEMIIFF